MKNAMSVRSSLNQSIRLAGWLAGWLRAGLLFAPLLLARPAAAGPPTPPPAAVAAAPKSPAAAVPPAANRPPASTVVERLQKVYEGTTSLKAKFSQTLSGPMGKRQASGAVLLKKPGKMRWDYEKPEKKLFVADGTMLWMYEPEDEQAFRQPLSSSQLPAQVSFLFGRGSLLKEFEVSYFDGQKLGEPGDFVLKLVPKQATAQYKHLVFVVDPQSLMVKQTLLYDQQGGTNHLTFAAIETNLKAGVDDSRFSFTPPEGTKIINPH
jgi:outer membrane lipoprotein carrier protein